MVVEVPETGDLSPLWVVVQYRFYSTRAVNARHSTHLSLSGRASFFQRCLRAAAQVEHTGQGSPLRSDERAPTTKPHHLRGLDSPCSVKRQPAPEGTRSRRCGRRQRGETSGTAHIRQRGRRGGPIRRLQQGGPPYLPFSSSVLLFLDRWTDLSGITFLSCSL